MPLTANEAEKIYAGSLLLIHVKWREEAGEERTGMKGTVMNKKWRRLVWACADPSTPFTFNFHISSTKALAECVPLFSASRSPLCISSRPSYLVTLRAWKDIFGRWSYSQQLIWSATQDRRGSNVKPHSVCVHVHLQRSFDYDLQQRQKNLCDSSLWTVSHTPDGRASNCTVPEINMPTCLCFSRKY